MNCEIITIGDEYLSGATPNNGPHRILKYISGMGFDINTQTVISSNTNQFAGFFNAALKRCQLLIVIGGLSSSYNVSSKETIARALNIKMVRNPKVERNIKKYYEARGEKVLQSYYKHSYFPANSVIFPNDIGIACGCCIDIVDHKIIILPSEPEQLEVMFAKYVVPHLQYLIKTAYAESNVCLFGVDEETVIRKFKLSFETKNTLITTQQNGGCVTVNIRVTGKDKASANLACEKLIFKLKNLFHDSICGIDSGDLGTITVNRLINAGKKIATAESCTAGMLSQMLTDIPGSSKVFEFGISAYSNRIKIDALGVEPNIIRHYGAVSAQTAILMAKNVREMSSADIGIGITGVAGPDKSEGKEVGTIYVAMADKDRGWVRLITPFGQTDREYLRILSCNTALDLVRRYLTSGSYGLLSGSFNINDLNNITVLTRNPALSDAPKTTEEKSKPAANQPIPDEEILNLVSNHIYSDKSNTDSNDSNENLITDTDNDFLIDSTEPESDYDTPILDSVYTSQEFVVEKDIPDSSYFDHIEYTHTYADNALDEFATSNTDSASKPKNSFAMRLIKAVFPFKGDSIKKIIFKALFLVLILIFTICSIVLIKNSLDSKHNRESLSKIQSEWDEVSINTSKTNGVFNAYDFLLELNSDTIGWLRISSTGINHPVFLTDNNDFYLNHNMHKKSSKYGSIFADSSNIITASRISQNITIYGNTMKDGSMFSELKNYKQLDYYRSHPTISFKTLYRDNVYKIFSVFIVNSDPDDDNSYAFNYAKSAFSDRADFMEFVAEAKARSIINTTVDVVEQDELLTLSTNTYEFDGARLVIMARRVRQSENFAVDTLYASINPNPVYPAIWYKTKGLTAPDTTSMINSALNSVSSAADSSSSDIESSSSNTQSSSSEPQSSSKPSEPSTPVITPNSSSQTQTSSHATSDQTTASDDSSSSDTQTTHNNTTTTSDEQTTTTSDEQTTTTSEEDALTSIQAETSIDTVTTPEPNTGE